MKFNQQRAFEKHLADAAPDRLCPIYFLLGKESFIRRNALDKLLSYFSNSIERTSYDADKLTVSQLMNELNAGVLFGGKRLVIIHEADKLDKSITASLEAYFEKPNHDICLIFNASTLNHNSNFYRKGEKVGIVFDPAEEKAWEKEQTAQSWIAYTVSLAGKRIAPAACLALVKMLGTQQSALSSEVEKLICYIGDRKEILLNDVTAIASVLSVETGWQLGEALFKRDASSALRIAKSILLDGTPLIVLLRQIRSQFQTEFQVCQIITYGGDAAAVTKQFPYMKGTILDRHITMAQGYGNGRFKKALLMIDETELKSKNSGTDPELLLEILIVKLIE